MTTDVKSPGPIERMLAQSDNPQLQRLCQMDNLELLSYMDELSEAGENLDATLYDAAEQLLDERAPIERPSAEEVIRGWESFKARHPEIYRPETVQPAKPAKRTYTLRRSIALVALISTLIVGMTAGVWAATSTEFLDLGEVVIRNIKYGPSGQLDSTDSASPYASLVEAFRETGDQGMPECATWIPSDFALTDLSVDVDEKNQYSYWAYYQSADRFLMITISKSYDMSVVMEKNPGSSVEEMHWHGYDYMIVKNIDVVNCEWEKGDYSYSVSGNISADELKSVVKSFK